MPAYRFARPEDYPVVEAFYNHMIDLMAGTDYDVRWVRGIHPSPELLRQAVESNQLLMGVLSPEELAAREGATPNSRADKRPQALNASVPALPAGGHLASAMVLNNEGAPGYEGVPWRIEAAPDETWILHVVATHPALHGYGLATGLLDACITEARRRGKRVLRLDTFPFNVRGQGLYEKFGFTRLGDYPIQYDDYGVLSIRVYELGL